MALERSEIVSSALDLLNEVGMDKLSTRALATRLGVAQPALYWHFKNKGDLLDAVNEEMRARAGFRRAPLPDEPWDVFVFDSAQKFRQVLLSTRDGARLNASTRPSGESFADTEAELKLLVDAGFTPIEALEAIIVTIRFVMGFVLEEQAEQERARSDPFGDFNETGELHRYPLLEEAMEPLIVLGTINAESVFDNSLRIIVDGIRARLAAKQAS